jgi:hypothetical protein
LVAGVNEGPDTKVIALDHEGSISATAIKLKIRNLLINFPGSFLKSSG